MVKDILMKLGWWVEGKICQTVVFLLIIFDNSILVLMMGIRLHKTYS
jgi:hypothetical protein